MEIITIESSAYKQLLSKIERIESFVISQQVKKVDEANIWLSSKEVMSLLGLSPRSLQRLREKKQIKYAFFGRACRYHISEVERFIKGSVINANAHTLEEFKHNYLLRTGGKKL